MTEGQFGWDDQRRRHVLPGRLMVDVPAVFHNRRVCQAVERHLRAHSAVRQVVAGFYTGRVLVGYDAQRLTADVVETLILAAVSHSQTIGGSGGGNTGCRQSAATADSSIAANVVSGVSERDQALVHWHGLDLNTVVQRLDTRLPRGLSAAEAAHRLQLYGENALPRVPPPNLTQVVLTKMANPITLLLLGTGGLSLVVAQWLEALAALGIAAMTTWVGVRQETKTNRELGSLERMAADHARVYRSDRFRTIVAEDVVPGDVLMLEEGDRVPADARLIFDAGLQLDESTLTGESGPVVKDSEALCAGNTPLANRLNMVYAGTTVAGGRARAVVVATGTATEFGRLAWHLVEQQRESTPLQKQLGRLARHIVWLIVGLGLIGTVGALAKGIPLPAAIARSAGVAVTAMPHGLPMTVTIALSIAIARLARRGAMARRLGAMESLGAVTTICTDKTGTLTRNRLVLQELVTETSAWTVTGDGYTPEGTFRRRSIEGHADSDDGYADAQLDDAAVTLLTTGVLCSNARLVQQEAVWQIEGDPTEGALLVAAAKAGIDPEALNKGNRRLRETPFSAQSRSMSVVCEDGDGVVTIVKGAPETVIPMCGLGDSAPRWLAEAVSMARRGQRVLAIARRKGDRKASPSDVTQRRRDEAPFTLVGLVGIVDTPREGAKEAVERCRRAGIRVMMLTGDHPATAVAVARQVGILEDDGHDGLPEVLTGADMVDLTDDDLLIYLPRLKVGARLTPEDKLRIVRLLKFSGEVVAMTGDGVNDAPALQLADVGIAMGLHGTEVTKGAANLVLTNDNFVAIAAAVESGRTAYENIRRSLTYSLSTNGGEAVMALLPIVFGMPLPVPVAALLLSNMVCDGPVSLSLATDDADRQLMTSAPRSARSGVFASRDVWHMGVRAVVMGVMTVALYGVGVAVFGSPGIASSMALAGLVGAKFVFARRLQQGVATGVKAKEPVKPNGMLSAVTAMGLGLTAFGMYVPAVAGMLGLAPLSVAPLAVVSSAVALQEKVIRALASRGILRTRLGLTPGGSPVEDGQHLSGSHRARGGNFREVWA